jgi:hypothetical protein
MFVKENQPGLLVAIENYFARAEERPSALSPQECLVRQRIRAIGESGTGLTVQTASTHEIGHGRVEYRELKAMTIRRAAQRLAWPGAKQVFEIRRETHFKNTAKTRQDVVYGITSLTAEQACPKRLLELCRGHWSIENRSHWVRDVTFDEDRSTVRTGSIPQVMAAMRNAVVSLMRLAGHKNLAAATRSHAANARSAVALVLEPPTFK